MATAVLLFTVSLVAVLAFGLGTGRMRVIPILSGSMSPLIEAGDVAVLTPMSSQSIKKGDVITFHAPVGERPLVMHRVLKVTHESGRPTVVTKGDANKTKDGWRAELQEEVVWKYTARVPYAGHVALWARRPVVRFGSVVLAVMIMMFVIMRVIWTTAPREVEANATG